jgi:hypothetical protein
MTTDNLDDLITSTARKMTDADPPVDLRARVLTRLDVRTRSTWTWPLLPAAATLMALAVVMTMVVRRPHPPIQALDTEPSVSSAAGRALAVDPEAAVERPVVVSDPAVVRRSGSSSGDRVSEAQTEWQARALPALSEPLTLTMRDIQPDVLSIRQLETRPLVIAPIGADDEK